MKQWKRLLARLPSHLPTTTDDVEKFCQSILSTYEMDDEKEYKRIIATTVMHIGQTEITAPKRFFYICLKKSLANRASYEYIQALNKPEATPETKESPDVAQKTPEAVV